MLQPVVRRTWAPKGKTPIQYSWARHDRLSVISAITLAPKRCRLGLYFDGYDTNISNEEVIVFLYDVHRALGRDVIVVLDRLNAHRTAARKMRELYGDTFSFEWLPAYAPDLNPVEQVWNRTKYTDLANFLPLDIDDLWDHIDSSIENTRSQSKLLRGFFKHAGLGLDHV